MLVASIAGATSPCPCVDLRLLLKEQLTRISAKQIISMLVIRFIFCRIFIIFKVYDARVESFEICTIGDS